MTCRRTKFRNYVDEEAKRKNTTKSPSPESERKVEHPFRILKRIFGFDKVRYRGLKKNPTRLCACFPWHVISHYTLEVPSSAEDMNGGKPRL